MRGDCNQEMTGDTDKNNQTMSEIKRSSIIVATVSLTLEYFCSKRVNRYRTFAFLNWQPERWDSMTRKWRDHSHLIKLLRLVLLDEVHILKEEGRGATLEVIVSRMQMANREILDASAAAAALSQSGHSRERIRIVAISATIPNIVDVAEWLRNSDTGASAQLRVFGDEYRPVKLIKKVLAFPNNSGSPFLFERSLDFKLSDVIASYSHGKPTLVVRPDATRKWFILSVHMADIGSLRPAKGVQTQGLRVADKRLAALIAHGIAFHHGGLSLEDRRLVEQRFLTGHLTVICTTSTLAVGINLPAYLVVIKGTSQYFNGQFRDYSNMDIEQMMGRAGRPQFETSGCAVIMTSLDKESHFSNIVSGKEMIESTLHHHLIEHLNAEVVLGSITSLDDALQWLKTTFLYLRIRKSPAHYQLKNCTKDIGKLSCEKRLEAMYLVELERLYENGFVMIDKTQGPQSRLQTTDIGKTMAKMYLKFNNRD
eukprot:jgi/Hompol1/5833/HPOL_004758-RA